MRPEAAMAGAEGDSVLRGGAWTTLSGFLPQVYTLLISIAAARVLGPDDFGRQSFIAFVGLTTHMVVSTGLGLALTRTVAEALGRGEPGQARGMVAWAFRVQILGALLCGGVLIAAGVLGSTPEAAWIAAGVGMAIATMQSVPNAALVGAHRFRAAAIIGLVSGALTVPVVVAVLAAGGGIVGMFVVEAVAVTFNLAWFAVVAGRVFRGIAPESVRAPELERAAIRFAGLTTVSALVTFVVWKRSEFFFLAHYSADSQIGLYSIAFAVVSAIGMLPERLAVVATPAFARLRGTSDTAAIRVGFGRLMRLLLLAMLPLAAGIISVGDAFLEVIYGDDYADVGPVLVILAAGLPLSAVSIASTSLLAGLEDAKRPLAAGAGAAVVNVALAFALIPGMDAVGAALANVGGQVAAGAVVVPAVRAATGIDWRWAPVIRGVVAAAASGAVARGILVAVGGVPGMVIAMLAGASVFILLAAVLRVLSPDDAAWADATAGHLLGGRVGALLRRAAGRDRAL